MHSLTMGLMILEWRGVSISIRSGISRNRIDQNFHSSDDETKELGMAEMDQYLSLY